MTLLFVFIGCMIAPQLGHPRFQGIFNYIQEFQGYISPGILAAFLFGLLIRRAPGAAGVAALVANPLIYGFLHWQFGDIAFLNRMAITFGVILLLMAGITLWRPLKEAVTLPKRAEFDMRTPPLVRVLGAAVIVITVTLYIIFW
jgi:SSS family solute:Na+ symporter